MTKRIPKRHAIERYPINIHDKGREEIRHKGRYEGRDCNGLEDFDAVTEATAIRASIQMLKCPKLVRLKDEKTIDYALAGWPDNQKEA